MRTAIHCSVWTFALLFLVSCTQSAGQPSYADPFTYCAAVGTIDAPDDRYVGPPVPLAIALGLRKAFGAPENAPLEPFTRGTFWRCMEGKVYACNVGANLPCQEKADTSRTPNQGMIQFCKDHPNRDILPAYAAGRATVYQWRCRDAKPEIVRQIAQPDAQGYLAHIWYMIESIGVPKR